MTPEEQQRIVSAAVQKSKYFPTAEEALVQKMDSVYSQARTFLLEHLKNNPHTSNHDAINMTAETLCNGLTQLSDDEVRKILASLLAAKLVFIEAVNLQ